MRKRRPPQEFFDREAERLGLPVAAFRAAWDLATKSDVYCDHCTHALEVVSEHQRALAEAQQEMARLRQAIRLRSRTIPAAVKRAVIERDGDRCRYCGKRVTGKGHFDHVTPAVAGGDESVENIVLACQPCNTRKGRWVLGSHKIRGMKLRPVPEPSDS